MLSRTVPAVCACLAVVGVASTAATGAGPVIVYGQHDAANAIHDGHARLAGISTAYRQAPAREDARYPRARRVGKLRGREFVTLSAQGMVSAVRRELAQRDVGGLVAIDEIEAPRYTPERLATLRQAMAMLGPDASRLVFYVAPGTVGQVGRVDRRRPLSAHLSQLVSTLAQGGHTYLALYHAGSVPFGRDEMARDLTGWRHRWPGDRASTLHVTIGPPRGNVRIAEIWHRVRASDAGRALLLNGPASYGLATRTDGLRWLTQYRTFERAPAAVPPGGAARLAVGGGLKILRTPAVMRRGSRVVVSVARPGRAVVLLTPVGGRRRRIAAITRPGSHRIQLPGDSRPGRYVLKVILSGDGLRDIAQRRIRITK
ncbi:MAG: hypothetical protein R2878_07275 [Thermoleophilia bacterium]